MEQEVEKKIRLDKWLKIARVYKTRNQAAQACDQGAIKVNEQVSKPSKIIKIGDTISAKFKWRNRVFDVLDISYKSVAAADARLLYREHELTSEEKELEEQRALFYQASKKLRPKYKGRPTKKDRRVLRKLKGH